MTPNHLELKSADGTKLNLEALYQIAPSCFTEVKDEKTGELRHVVNFTTLRQLLGDDAVDDAPEMYQFTWPGKQEARREAARPITDTLRPCPEESVDWDTTQNLYIEGDNLSVLKLLQKGYMGKVKMIYIDPPYNTGSDFVYHDDFAVSQKEMDLFSGDVDEEGNRYRKNTNSNGRFHSDWCSMIYSRLLIARSLLTEDGVIIIHIDEHEYSSIHRICQEIFGEYNDLGTIIWDKRNPKGAVAGVAYQHESIIVFSKNKEIFASKCAFQKEKENAKEMMAYVQRLIKKNGRVDESVRAAYKEWIKSHQNELSGGEKAYALIDDNGRIYQPVSMAAPDKPETRSHRELIHPHTKLPCPVPAKGWRFTDEKMDELLKSDRIEFGKDETTQPRQKYFLDENMTEAVSSLLYFGGSDTAMDLPFDNPKPLYVAKRLINSVIEKDDICLDFFSGSSTAAHAVMQLNFEDSGNRKFIMVQLPEGTPEDSDAYKAGYRTIPEIAKERIRRAGKKIKEEAGILASSIDTGFRVFKLSESNFNEVYFSPKEFTQDLLSGLENNIKEGRTDLDLLFGAMLDWGVQLSLPMSKETVDGCDIYTVNEGDLVACFSENVTENVVSAMAAKMPLRVLFRDSCFSEDKAKINVFELFKQKLDWGEDEAIKNIRVI